MKKKENNFFFYKNRGKVDVHIVDIKFNEI